MQALQARMRYLRRGEAIAAVALPLVLAFNWLRTDANLAWAERTAAVALVSFILLQGVLYWHLKLRCVDEHRPLPEYFKRLFRSFQYVNMALIGAMLIVLSTSSAALAYLRRNGRLRPVALALDLARN